MYTRRKTRVGVVTSNKMQKTVVVAVEAHKRHPLYKKTIRRTRHYKAHDEKEICAVGDTVRIIESRPLSREKRWRVTDILVHRELAEIAPGEIDASLLGISRRPEPAAEAEAPEAVAAEPESEAKVKAEAPEAASAEAEPAAEVEVPAAAEPEAEAKVEPEAPEAAAAEAEVAESTESKAEDESAESAPPEKGRRKKK
jgi:small subunit ribosomal protein S17